MATASAQPCSNEGLNTEAKNTWCVLVRHVNGEERCIRGLEDGTTLWTLLDKVKAAFPILHGTIKLLVGTRILNDRRKTLLDQGVLPGCLLSLIIREPFLFATTPSFDEPDRRFLTVTKNGRALDIHGCPYPSVHTLVANQSVTHGFHEFHLQIHTLFGARLSLGVMTHCAPDVHGISQTTVWETQFEGDDIITLEIDMDSRQAWLNDGVVTSPVMRGLESPVTPFVRFTCSRDACVQVSILD